MADATTSAPKIEKYCKQYYWTEVCSNENCEYLHKRACEITVVPFVNTRECDYFLGKPAVHKRLTRVCRYFRRGNCKHRDQCQFEHEFDPRLRRQVDRSVENRSTANMPSTSSQSQVEENAQEGKKEQKKIMLKIDPKLAEAAADSSTKVSEQVEGACASPPLLPSNWVNAPEFVPKWQQKPRSYAEAVNPDAMADDAPRICPYMNKDGICTNILDCQFLHSELCDLCQRLVLHPCDEELRKRHRQECIMQHEKDMELSFAIARSKEKSCGICFEVIMEKTSGQQRFGILPNCNHCFCLTCIRKWRQARQFENKIIRACPECRTTSDFICPSMYWVDTKEDKEKLIEDYKKALSKKDCKYFKKGNGQCPFGNKCFYLHAFPDGRVFDVGPPPRVPRRRAPMRQIDVSDIEIFQRVMLWDYLDEEEFQWHTLADDLVDDLNMFFTDSDDSDFSEYEI